MKSVFPYADIVSGNDERVVELYDPDHGARIMNKPVTLPVIKAHINGADPNGNDVVAIYPMLENNLCPLLVFDFDNHAKGAQREDYDDKLQMLRNGDLEYIK